MKKPGKDKVRTIRENRMGKENKNYKNSVFTDLFYSDRDAKIHLLSLYNADQLQYALEKSDVYRT